MKLLTVNVHAWLEENQDEKLGEILSNLGEASSVILNKNQKQRYNSIMTKELTQTQVEELKQALKDKGTSKNFSKNL